MKPTKLLQEIRKMRFEEAYEGWNTGRLTQTEAARIPGVCERSFRCYILRYKEEGLEDLSPEQAADRLALEERLQISHETIYRHIYADQRNRGDLCRHLRGQKPYRKRYASWQERRVYSKTASALMSARKLSTKRRA